MANRLVIQPSAVVVVKEWQVVVHGVHVVGVVLHPRDARGSPTKAPADVDFIKVKVVVGLDNHVLVRSTAEARVCRGGKVI